MLSVNKELNGNYIERQISVYAFIELIFASLRDLQDTCVLYVHACIGMCMLAYVHFYHGAWDSHCSSGFLIKSTRHLRRKVLWRDTEKKMQRSCQSKDEMRGP